jgi:hypothetical protein
MNIAIQAPELFTTTPALAIPKAIANAGLDSSHVDFYEINEAFAVCIDSLFTTSSTPKCKQFCLYFSLSRFIASLMNLDEHLSLSRLIENAMYLVNG